jgi:hypothetical protein
MSLRNLWLPLVVFMLSCEVISAQETQFLPEVDVYLKLNSISRLRVQASNTRQGGDPTQLTIGPDLELYVKPLIRLRQVTSFDLDDAKSRPLVITAGYRYLAAPGSPSTNRMELTATSHFPAKPGLLLSDRNRSDLDWSNGKFKWRYRNKLEVEKALAIRSYHPAPYSSVEVYYESQYQKWSTTEIYAEIFRRSGPITAVNLHVAIAVYLLFGLAWASAYLIVIQMNLDSFQSTVSLSSSSETEWYYYSFVTLTTLGNGEITPLTRIARVLAAGEAVTGQLYFAVLIARLIGLEIIASQQKSAKDSD